jgi:hypothetical protein
MRLWSMSDYVDPDRNRHTIQLWAKDSGGYGEWYGDLSFIQSKLDEYKKTDLGPTFIDSFADGANITYSLMTRPSNGLLWAVTLSADSGSYQKDFEAHEGKGFRPIVVSVR